MDESKWSRLLLRIMSYVLVAVISVSATMAYCAIIFSDSSNIAQVLPTVQNNTDKLDELRKLIEERFIGETDRVALDDAAATAMVSATGDRWSYYIPASQYAANQENMENSYVGIGITITQRKDGTGLDVNQVEPAGGAKEAGILPGDIVTAVEGQKIADLGMDGVRNLIRGEEGTSVSITILRNGQTREVSVIRRRIQVVVASGKMLEDNIGLIKIVNFNDRCAQETIAQIERLREEGAQSLIFDVRFNPGGYKDELVQLLDYLLPEGEVFRSIYYNGREQVDQSDANCLDMPFAVLINADSYSAAEFFAAALDEYDRAILVGEATVGKSYFQNTIKLSDGSAVALSVGKYVTPKGVTLAEVGGLKPEIEVKVDEKIAAQIYGELLEDGQDPQLQAAIRALKKVK